MLQPTRLDWIDALRGFSICAMIIYHACWNIEAFRFADLGIFTETSWIWFARLIAGSFLVLVGVSLSLADANHVKRQKMFRRIAVVAIAAFFVSVVTYVVFRSTFVYFGILHHIALASTLCLLLLGRPTWILVVSTAVVVLVHESIMIPLNGSRLWAITGLVNAPPPTNDYVPLLPWIAAVLAGMLTGRIIVAHPGLTKLLTSVPGMITPFVWMGRRSLVIYLVHQPILFGLAWSIFKFNRL